MAYIPNGFALQTMDTFKTLNLVYFPLKNDEDRMISICLKEG